MLSLHKPISFWPQGHDLNKLGKGLLDYATYQISKFRYLIFGM